MERTLKCCVLNGGVFGVSLILFENLLLPLVQTLLYIILAGSQERADALWSYTQPVLSVAFSVVPIKIIGAALNLLHNCLLHSLYSFEYKWFSQGLELHERLDYVETNWPYFLG